jgi:predicted phage tail protein
VLTVDSDVDLPTSGTVSVVLPDGIVENRTISSVAGTAITVTAAFTTAPQSWRNVADRWRCGTTNDMARTWYHRAGTWKGVRGVNEYRIRWREEFGNWTEVRKYGPLYEIEDVTTGNYQVEVYAISCYADNQQRTD